VGSRQGREQADSRKRANFLIRNCHGGQGWSQEGERRVSEKERVKRVCTKAREDLKFHGTKKNFSPFFKATREGGYKSSYGVTTGLSNWGSKLRRHIRGVGRVQKGGGEVNFERRSSRRALALFNITCRALLKRKRGKNSKGKGGEVQN